MDVLLVALMPPRRRASFLLGGAVSVSMLRGDSETECLLEDVVDDGLDDDEPFFLEKRLVVFLDDDEPFFLEKRLVVFLDDDEPFFLDVDFQWIKGVDFF
jgi:hypothetical protein